MSELPTEGPAPTTALGDSSLGALVRWLALGGAVGVICGAASAAFLWLLARATGAREAHLELVWALPLAGLALGWIWQRIGQSIRGGASLVLDTIHDDGPQLPLRMAPLVLLGTVATHLFGGSAGREGTAVQMGASLSDGLAHWLGLTGAARRVLLVAGLAGGFGSVFGTPIAGAMFGLEVLVAGGIDGRALVPALVASLVGDFTTRGLGIAHGLLPAVSAPPLGLALAGKWLVVAAAVALVAIVFIELHHALKALAERWLPSLPWRMAAGGAAVVAAWQLVGSADYLGLGVPGIERALVDPALPVHAFAVKLGFTVVTLAAGFVGGEVTPLFFIGAALGNALAAPLGLPVPLVAGVCLAAVFGAAANTPWALALMATELLGGSVLPHAVLVCVVAYLLTGHRGLYVGQRLARSKSGRDLVRLLPLRAWRDRDRSTPAP